MASKNLYHRRLVAESAAKACWICYKPSSTVLITPEQDDWFHICPGHLKDRKFAIAKDEDDLAEKKRQEELEKEIEVVKKEFEEKMRKKLARRKQKEYEKEDRKEEAKDDEQDAKEQEAKLKELEQKKEPAKAVVDGPRVFELHKNFHQMRVQKKRDAEMAKRHRERLRNGSVFPSVPGGAPG
jgi:septal ring factor EnvC (AmiA/AmiB activator)